MKALYPVIILAGGLATRLRPVTQNIPKALIDVKGEPFINHQLRLLYSKGIRQVILSVGYLGEMIEELIGSGREFGIDIQYSYDGPTLLGTAGAIQKALPRLGEVFFVLNGDSYLGCDYEKVQDAFLVSKKAGLMTIFHNNNRWDTSNVEYSNGKLLAYSKQDYTSRMHYIDYGLAMFHRGVFVNPELKETPLDLAIIYKDLLKRNELAAVEVKSRFYEVGSFKGINELDYYLRKNTLENNENLTIDI